jgi:hypothetical protein
LVTGTPPIYTKDGETSTPAIVSRLVEAGLVPGATEAERQTLDGLSERELEILVSIKARLDDAIGVDEVHSPQDGGMFW